MTRGAAWSIPSWLGHGRAGGRFRLETDKGGVLSWDMLRQRRNQTGKVLVTTGNTGVTVTVTASGATSAANNGDVTSTPPAVCPRCMRFYDLNNVNNTSQTVTITFSKPVQNLSFSLLDVDSEQPMAAYEDLVDHQHRPAGPPPSTAT